MKPSLDYVRTMVIITMVLTLGVLDSQDVTEMLFIPEREAIDD
jgi:hypothetical protein